MVFKQIFLDTTILIDIITNRKPFSNEAILIFDYCQRKKIRMYATSHSIATLYSLLKTMEEEKELRSIIDDLLDTISVIAISEPILRKSIKSSHKDFEDAIQIVAAQSIHTMNCIITRDIKDYKKAKISVFTPDEFLNKFF
ncbi:MAG TPA: PIN domain-containing protein [Flavobacterium sp.]|uniref:PIN domain-containing protein n=1 Tax=Flavobacterium sp. HNIBRBA15423 TaxID=3458683 RepID=UPI002CFA1DCB|nr:PIN domain-containing protein [Flavobacterium sp.]